ncbi:MAG: diguanylate cyclase [Clostridium sp.]
MRISKKNISRKSIKACILCTLVLVVSLALCIFNVGKDDILLNTIIESIISYKSSDLDTHKINEIIENVDSIIESTDSDESKAKAYFIMGYYENVLKEYEKSNKNLEKALQIAKKYSFNLAEVIILSHNEMSKNYFELGDYGNSKYSFDQAIHNGDNKKYKDLIANMHIKRAKIVQNQDGKTSGAIEHLKKAIELEPSDEILADTYLSLSRYYLLENTLDISLEYNIRALKLAEKKGLELIHADALIELGSNYSYNDDYENSIKVLNSALELETVKNSIQKKINTLAYLADAYCGNEEYEKSVNTVNELLSEVQQLDEHDRPREYIWAYTMRAAIANLRKNPEEAIMYLKKVSKEYEGASKELLYIDSQIHIISSYGEAYYNLGDYDKALECHLKAMNLLKDSNRVSIAFLNSIEMVGKAYRALNQYEKACEVEEKRIEIEKKIRKDNNKNSLVYVVDKVNAEEKENSINRLKSQRIIIALIIIALLIVLLIKSSTYKKQLSLKESYNEKLKDLTLKDSLTSIWNRRKLHELVKDMQFIDSDKAISFIMIDIDFFKLYNDNYGHLDGDRVLIKITKCITEVFKSDVVGRYGGEEFYVLINSGDNEYICNKLDKLKEAISNLNIEHKKSNISNKVTVSMGASMGAIKDIDAVMLKADENLYKAKKNGRNRYSL